MPSLRENVLTVGRKHIPVLIMSCLQVHVHTDSQALASCGQSMDYNSFCLHYYHFFCIWDISYTVIIKVKCLFGTVELQCLVLLCGLQVWLPVWGTTSPCMQWHPQGSALLALLWSTQKKRVRITVKFLSTCASFKFVKLLWFVTHNLKVHHYEMESFVLFTYLLADYCLQSKLTHLLYSTQL